MGRRLLLLRGQVSLELTSVASTWALLTFLSMTMYLDYATVFPFTGGELLYVGAKLTLTSPFHGLQEPLKCSHSDMIDGGDASIFWQDQFEKRNH